jgi:hypothetical protein
MSWVGAVAAIQQRFRDNWALTPLASVAFENEPFTVPEQEWVYFEVMGDRGRIAGYGSPGANLVRREGMVMIHVFVPQNSGGARAMQLAEAASLIFGLKAFSGIQFWAPFPPSPPSGDSEMGNRAVDGSWWRSYTAIPFQYDQQM